jgi:hypothetical protein
MRTLKKFAIAATAGCLLAPAVFGQQDYVGKYDVYGGFMYLSSPLIKLGESGFHTQIGTNPTRWYAVGFDFSTGSGDTVLVPSMVKQSVNELITAQLAPLIKAGALPPNYQLRVPMHSSSQTYAMGPQLCFRHFRSVTLFVRPDLGAMHESATPHPTDLIGKGLAAQLAPSGVKEDWTYFYGFAGGADFNVTRQFGLRVQVDFARDHLFNDLLDWRNSVRCSIGPTFHFGPNVPAR